MAISSEKLKKAMIIQSLIDNILLILSSDLLLINLTIYLYCNFIK